jgi:Asp-tRNA(Asn)/Glu-tRNA(Gln) amidotransferase B subunit
MNNMNLLKPNQQTNNHPTKENENYFVQFGLNNQQHSNLISQSAIELMFLNSQANLNTNDAQLAQNLITNDLNKANTSLNQSLDTSAITNEQLQQQLSSETTPTSVITISSALATTHSSSSISPSTASICSTNAPTTPTESQQQQQTSLKSKRLHVTNIPFFFTENDLTEIFSVRVCLSILQP